MLMNDHYTFKWKFPLKQFKFEFRNIIEIELYKTTTPIHFCREHAKTLFISHD